MKTWIALLRGINVGGNNLLPMKELRALLEGTGFQNVRTYIQSGNIVFASEETKASTLEAAIADRIDEKFGFRPRVLVLQASDIRAAIEGNPYPEGTKEPKNLHIYFLAQPAGEADLASLEQIKTPTERFTLKDRVFYLHAPEGVARSKLAMQAEKLLKVPATARNLRSTMKIAELAE